jgi:hypothetical protein
MFDYLSYLKFFKINIYIFWFFITKKIQAQIIILHIQTNVLNNTNDQT